MKKKIENIPMKKERHNPEINNKENEFKKQM